MPELNQDKKSFSSVKDKNTISSGFSDSYFLPEGVIKIKVCEDEKGNLCKANKYCRDSYEALFLKEFIPLECVDN